MTSTLARLYQKYKIIKMKKLEMIYDLRDWPDGNMGHLQPTDEVVNAFKNISKNSSHKIGNILEFGFNTGVSSYIILETLPKTKITSIEISKYLNAEEGVSRLKKKFHDRYKIVWGDSQLVFKELKKKTIKLPFENYDTAFIDGGHTTTIVDSDIQMCKLLGIKNFIFDDADCPNILPAIEKHKDLKLINKYPYSNIRKINGTYYLKKSKGWVVGLHHYILI